jgi:hypothetical protein
MSKPGSNDGAAEADGCDAGCCDDLSVASVVREAEAVTLAGGELTMVVTTRLESAAAVDVESSAVTVR